MVPRAGVSIVFFVVECVIHPQCQPGLRSENGDTVDLSAGGRNVLFITPSQAAEKVELTFFRVTVIAQISSGECIIARLVEVGLFQGYAIQELVKVACIEIDHIGQHGVAAFFSMERQHLSDGPFRGERIEKILRIIAEIHPDTRTGLIQRIDRGGQRFRRGEAEINAVHFFGNVVTDGILRLGKQQDLREAARKVMAHSRVDFDVVLTEDHRNRAIEERVSVLAQEIADARIAHVVASKFLASKSGISRCIARQGAKG